MRWITRDDFIEAYTKGVQRGGAFLLSKLNPSAAQRTRSAFDQKEMISSNWWDIPMVQERWNQLITGNPKLLYPDFVREHIFDRKDIKILGLGSGNCAKELHFASFGEVEEVTCVDLAINRLEEGRRVAKERGWNHVSFIGKNVSELELPEDSFDVVLFNSSLHHFYDVEDLLKNRIKPCLRPGGWVIINEYVGPDRLQFPKDQIQRINELIQTIPKAWRKRLKTESLKTSYTGPGYLRMVLADPSECVDSSSILPTLREWFTPLIERPFGGNLLMGVLKDIAHHFAEPDEDQTAFLEDLFSREDDWLQNHSSDYYFGVYQK